MIWALYDIISMHANCFIVNQMRSKRLDESGLSVHIEIENQWNVFLLRSCKIKFTFWVRGTKGLFQTPSSLNYEANIFSLLCFLVVFATLQLWCFRLFLHCRWLFHWFISPFRYYHWIQCCTVDVFLHTMLKWFNVQTAGWNITFGHGFCTHIWQHGLMLLLIPVFIQMIIIMQHLI